MPLLRPAPEIRPGLPGKSANPEFFGPFPGSCPRLPCWAGAVSRAALARLTRLLVGGGHDQRHHRRRSAPGRHRHRLPAPRRRPRLRGLLALAGPLPLRPLPPGGRRPHRTQGLRPGRAGPRHLGPAQLLGLPDRLPPLPPLRPPPAPRPAFQAQGHQLHLPLRAARPAR